MYDIDVSSILNGKTNLDIITYSLRGPYNGSVTRGGYRDLTMELPSLKAWEKEARKSFKGRRDVEEREAEAARIRESEAMEKNENG